MPVRTTGARGITALPDPASRRAVQRCQLTGLPVAAALAGGPAVGAAVLVAQQLMGKQLEKITRYQYEVRGSWNEPVITRVDTRPKESPRPALLDGDY
jgi:uncharacterized protein YhdP